MPAASVGITHNAIACNWSKLRTFYTSKLGRHTGSQHKQIISLNTAANVNSPTAVNSLINSDKNSHIIETVFSVFTEHFQCDVAWRHWQANTATMFMASSAS